jgi:hypothetical protein
VGDRYPSAAVRGIDLSPIQPSWVPPNVSFLVDDCEEEWLTWDCDLVHFRFMVLILRDVPKVLGHAFEYVDLLFFSATQPAHPHTTAPAGGKGAFSG